MAAIGEMCLNKGVYHGKRIVSEKWLDEMTAPNRKLGMEFGNLSYGYLWWIIDAKTHTYAAIGDGGNVIYVNTDKNIAVGVASTFKPRVFDRIDFIETKILPCFE
jgi:CubicO group peptidase (beta-lactamase class C family)